MTHRHRVSFIVLSSALLACTSVEPAPHEPAPRGLSITVSPLELSDVIDACYAIGVANDAGEPVWSADGICASQYGDLRGSVSYVGTCDASDNDPSDNIGTEVAHNTVTVELEGLWDQDGLIDEDTWVNPCPVGDGCALTVNCVENSDVPVTFNLTISRSAMQGFFDVAVNFADVFCSAKLDTCRGDEPMNLLFDANGERAPTVVLALACTGGAGDATDTHLYRQDIEIRCGESLHASLDPSAGPGNAYSDIGDPQLTTDPDVDDAVFQYAVYEGHESLACGAVSCNKNYWNVAIGLDVGVLSPGCRIVTVATASEGALDNGATPEATTYPVIAVDATLVDANGALLCQQLGLDETQAVHTAYTGLDEPLAFAYELGVEGDVVDTHPLAPPPPTPVDRCVVVVDQDGRVRRFDASGTPVWTATPHSGIVFGVGIDAADNVYSGGLDGFVRKTDSNGNQVVGSGTDWPVLHGSTVLDIAIDTEGNVYSGTADGTVRKMSPSGVVLWQTNGLGAVTSIAVAPDGSFVYAGGSDSVKKLDATGSELAGGWPFTGFGSGFVRGLAADSAGHVYGGSEDFTVRKIGPSGAQIWSFATGSRNDVQDVFVDAAGFVYDAETSGRVRKILPDGSAAQWTFTAPSGNALGVAVATTGHVYSGGDDKMIRKFAPDGTPVTSGFPIANGASVRDVAVCR